jgi:hypothetical protein
MDRVNGIQVYEGDGVAVHVVPPPPLIIVVERHLVDEIVYRDKRVLDLTLRTRLHVQYDGATMKGGKDNPGARSVIASFRRMKVWSPYQELVIQQPGCADVVIVGCRYLGKQGYSNDGYGIAHSTHRFGWRQPRVATTT